MKNSLRSATAAAALTLLATAAQAGLIGKTITHECPECGPPLSVDFVAAVGGPEVTPFNQYAVDVEDYSIKVSWLIDSNSIIDPGHFNFSWNPSDYALDFASFDASSTLVYGLSFTANSISLDISGVPVRTGDYVLVNLSPVPEPAAWALMGLGLAALGWRNRRAA